MTIVGPKVGDLEPPFVLDITAETGVDFTAATSWRMIARRRSVPGVLLFTDTAPSPVVDPVNKNKVTLTHAWVSGETALPDVLQIEAEVAWPGGKKQTFPKAGYVTVLIMEDLDYLG